MHQWFLFKYHYRSTPYLMRVLFECKGIQAFIYLDEVFRLFAFTVSLLPLQLISADFDTPIANGIQ